MRLNVLLGLTLLSLAACSPQNQRGAASSAALAPAEHPESGLSIIPLTVTSPGTTGPIVHRFRVEHAATSDDQAHGLMFRAKLGADEGMLFPMNPPRNVAFWMKNTVIPLDIIFIGADRRVLNVAARTVPYSEAQLPSAGVAAAVLELNGGRAAELGISAGDRVDW